MNTSYIYNANRLIRGVRGKRSGFNGINTICLILNRISHQFEPDAVHQYQGLVQTMAALSHCIFTLTPHRILTFYATGETGPLFRLKSGFRHCSLPIIILIGYYSAVHIYHLTSFRNKFLYCRSIYSQQYYTDSIFNSLNG